MEERWRTLLDERSRQLAQRRSGEARHGRTRRYMVCACGGERIGIAIEEVAAVLPIRPCTPLPFAPPAVPGIIALSGVIVTVIDLASALGIPSDPSHAEPVHDLRVRRRVPAIALRAGTVLGIAVCHDAADEGSPPPDGATSGLGHAAVSGYAAAEPERPDGLGGFAILNLPRLLEPYLP